MRKKSFLFLPYVWIAAILSAIVALAFSNSQSGSNKLGTKNQNQSQRISAQDQKKLANQADETSSYTIGKIRRWQNNNFTGIELSDNGFAVLTGDNTSGYSVTRTDSFGGIFWTYNPKTDKSNPSLLAGNDQKTTYAESIVGKGVAEIQQDPDKPNIFYALLVPDAFLNNTTPTGTTASYNYDNVVANPQLQATVVQIVENLSNLNDPIRVNAFVNINPKTMVQNYPTSWTTSGGATFFSKTDHPGWFSNSETMNMGYFQYITNMGNLYIANNYVLIFGGNGTQFTSNPDALSIGVYSIDFNGTFSGTSPINFSGTIQTTGIPYAYVLAGLSTNQNVGRAPSRLPVGQSANFGYVPRMAVGGVSAWPGLNSSDSPSVFLAGSLTVGQDNKAWNWAKTQTETVGGVSVPGRPTTVGLSADGGTNPSTTPAPTTITSTGMKGYGSYGDKYYAYDGKGNGTNNTNSADAGSGAQQWRYLTRWTKYNPSTTPINSIPAGNLASAAPEKNSVDPLTLAGFQLGISALLNLTSQIRNTTIPALNVPDSYLYILNSDYMDFGVNLGFILGYWMPNDHGLNRDEPNNAYGGVLGGSGQWGRPQQVWDGGLGMYTSLFGYSPKSVGNLVPYNSQRKGNDGQENNFGFVMQVGAFIYFFNLTGFDGYAQLPQSDFKPVLTLSTAAAPTKPTSGTTLNSTNANGYAMYYTYNAMPVSSYQYDATLGNSLSYFKGSNNQLASANTDSLANVKPWGDFSGLAVINDVQPAVASVWTTSSGKASVYVNNGFSGPSFTDSNNKTTSASVALLDNVDNILKYYSDGNWLINGTSINNVNITDLSSQPVNNGTANLSQISGIIDSPNKTTYYFQMNNLGINYFSYSPVVLNLVASFQNAVVDKKNYLGSGSFITNPGDIITTKAVGDLYDDINGFKVLKNSLVSSLFNYQKPTVLVNGQSPEIRILLTDINVVTQTASFTAQVKNPFTNEWQLIPSSNTSKIDNQNANVIYKDFFGKQPSYLLAVAISVPLIVVALVVGLGFGIGIPINKNKKALKQGFDISNKKVDTLTTAVGSVFKQIINRTQIGNIKKSPQMLKSANKAKAAPKPPVAAKPKAPVPGAPRPGPAPLKKPAAPINNNSVMKNPSTPPAANFK